MKFIDLGDKPSSTLGAKFTGITMHNYASKPYCVWFLGEVHHYWDSYAEAVIAWDKNVRRITGEQPEG